MIPPAPFVSLLFFAIPGVDFVSLNPFYLLRPSRSMEPKEDFRRAEELRAEILKGGLAVRGVEATRDALSAGRVSVLVLLKDASIPGWICERCQALEARRRPPEVCPSCGGPASPVDVVEELYELAVRTGAEVEFVEEDACLASSEGVGALLRY